MHGTVGSAWVPWSVTVRSNALTWCASGRRCWPRPARWSAIRRSAIAAPVIVNSSGRCDRVRIALRGVGTGPVRARSVEEALVGEVPHGEVLAAATQRVVDEIDPPSDIHGSAAYRRKLAIVMTRRAVE